MAQCSCTVFILLCVYVCLCDPKTPVFSFILPPSFSCGFSWSWQSAVALFASVTFPDISCQPPYAFSNPILSGKTYKTFLLVSYHIRPLAVYSHSGANRILGLGRLLLSSSIYFLWRFLLQGDSSFSLFHCLSVCNRRFQSHK